MALSRRLFLLLPALAPSLLAACAAPDRRDRASFAGETPELDGLIAKWATNYEVPPELVHRLVRRESGYNPAARNGPYYGLLQLLPETARTMGHRGPPESLLDPDTNLRYGVKYLRGAWLVADGDFERAIAWYAKGYYYEAKRRGLLVRTGLKAG